MYPAGLLRRACSRDRSHLKVRHVAARIGADVANFTGYSFSGCQNSVMLKVRPAS